MRLNMTASLPPQPSSIAGARNILSGLLTLTAADAQTGDHLALILTEACANVVQHGDDGAPIDLSVTVEADRCVLEVGNCGPMRIGHLPTRLPDPAQTSGRGLPLIATLSDHAEFLPTKPGYVLLRVSVRLRLSAPPEAAP